MKSDGFADRGRIHGQANAEAIALLYFEYPSSQCVYKHVAQAGESPGVKDPFDPFLHSSQVGWQHVNLRLIASQDRFQAQPQMGPIRTKCENTFMESTSTTTRPVGGPSARPASSTVCQAFSELSMAYACYAIGAIVIGLVSHGTSRADESIRHTRVFTQGIDGYVTYRIPAIETAQDGTLLAFAEARKYNWYDPGDADNDIDLVLKRSTDGGLTWSAMQIIEDPGEKWSSGNPATVVDKDNGRVWLFYIRVQPKRAGQQTLARTSDDHGVTWSDPIDLSEVAGVVGPGGPIWCKGGLLIAPTFGAKGLWAFYSEDHGKTWHAGESIPGNPGGNENQLVELSDGKLLMDCRQSSSIPHRWMATSDDRGKTWSNARPGMVTRNTTVACAIENYTQQSEGVEKNRIVWTGPRGGRKNMVIRVSYDDAQTFPVERLFGEGRGGYSDITILDDDSIGVFWEGSGRRRNSKWSLTFTRLTQEFIEPKP